MKVKEIYVAGPMTGYPEFNFPAFFAAQQMLEDLGWKVWNPAAKDKDEGTHLLPSFSSGDNIAAIAEGWDYKKSILWDVHKVVTGDGIYMLKGWELSSGAKAEHAVAQFIKKQNPEYIIMYQIGDLREYKAI